MIFKRRKKDCQNCLFFVFADKKESKPREERTTLSEEHRTIFDNDEWQKLNNDFPDIVDCYIGNWKSDYFGKITDDDERQDAYEKLKWTVLEKWSRCKEHWPFDGNESMDLVTASKKMENKKRLREKILFFILGFLLGFLSNLIFKIMFNGS